MTGSRTSRTTLDCAANSSPSFFWNPVFVLLICLLAGSAQPSLAQGGPPLLTDDPGTPGNRNWEINLGATTEIGPGVRDYELPIADFNYGWGNRIQLKFEMPWLVQTGDAGTFTEAGDGKAGVKWRFLDEDKHHLDISTYPQLSFNNPGPRRLVDRGVEMLLPLEFAKTVKRVALNWDFGFNIRQYRSDQWLMGFAVGLQATRNLELLAEVHDVPDRTFSENEFVFQVGGRRKLSRHYVLLFAAGRGLPGSTLTQPSFLGYAGLQFLF